MSNNRYKLLVVDIDGTLLDRRGVISAVDREALLKARDAGVIVSLSTGRAIGACKNVLKELALDGFHVFFDGALVCNNIQDEEVYAQPIGSELVRDAIAFSQRNGIPLELYSATHYFVEQESWRTDIHTEFFNLAPTLRDFASLWEKERIIKGGIVVASAEEEAEVRRFGQEFRGRLDLGWARAPAYPDFQFINVLATGVSKGRALRELASHLGIVMSEVIAMGDGINDISLLSAAGTAVAMQNAPAEVKAVADYVTADVEHGGVAGAVRRFLL